MKKTICNLLLLALCILVASCGEDENYKLENLVPQQYHKISYIKNYGTHELNLYTTQESYTDSLIIIKGGSDPNTTAGYTMKVLDQAEVDTTYSEQDGVAYSVLPSSTYSFDNGEAINFASGLEGQYFPVSFKPVEIFKLIEQNPDLTYVLPLRMESETDSANADMCDVLYKVSVKSPVIGFTNALTNDMMVYKSLDVTLPMVINNCDRNEQDITLELSKDNLQAAADAYNSSNGTSYKLLPQASYTLGSAGFAKGSLTGEMKLTVNRAQLQNDQTYVLPLRVGSTSVGEAMQVDSTWAYLVVSCPLYATKEMDRSAWKVLLCNNDNAIGGTADNAGIKAIMDGNNNTYWHSVWQAGYSTSFSHNGVAGDDYVYSGSYDYHAFKGRRAANKTVFVLDLGAVHNVVAVATRSRSNTYDLGSADVFISNDSEFKFLPVAKGGKLSDYEDVALNNWTKLLTFTQPRSAGVHWYELDDEGVKSGGVKGRYLKLHVLSSNREDVVNIAEFYVKELLAVDGVAVK